MLDLKTQAKTATDAGTLPLKVRLEHASIFITTAHIDNPMVVQECEPSVMCSAPQQQRIDMARPGVVSLTQPFPAKASGGFGALFKGCGLSWLKLAPSAGLSFFVYEWAKEALELSVQ